jgi:hypothetical protein
MEMRELHKFDNLYQGFDDLDLDSISSMFNSMAVHESRYKLQFLLFMSKEDPIGLIEKWKRWDFEVDIKEREDHFELSITRTIKRRDLPDGERKLSGSVGLWRFAGTDIWIAFTSDSPDFFEKGLIRFIESYRPDFSRMFLNSMELKDVFLRLERELDCQVWISKAIVYSRLDNASIVFDKLPFLDMFTSPQFEDKYVDKIEFTLRRGREDLYHGFVSREGICYYYYGKVKYFFTAILPAMITGGEAKIERFEGIERVSGSGSARPVILTFDEDVLADRGQNERLVDALANVERAAIAVYHMNPYIHATLTDFFDGSSIDVVSHGTDRLALYPGYNCSIHSLMRVSERISRNFHEGRVEEAVPRSFGLSDFIGA